MEYVLFKLLPIFLVFYCEYGESFPKEEDYSMSGNTIDQGSTIKNRDIHVFTQSVTSHTGYVFYPASKNKKCFSFELRTKVFPHILLSATPSVAINEKLEVLLEYYGNSVIRTKDGKHAVSTTIKDIINDKELRGFWIRWLDDYLLEVGRNTDDSPILSYRLPEKISINFIGILSYTTSAEWILHEDPHCGAYNITKNIEGDSRCTIAAMNLQKSQQHILNQIKKQHGIFKVSHFRSKEILLEHQELIKIYIRNAEEIQNKIYAEDKEIYCPFKSITFNEIIHEYFKFLEELQKEFSILKKTSILINGTNTSLEIDCSAYSILQNTFQNIIKYF